jgi:hypothetical protein
MKTSQMFVLEEEFVLSGYCPFLAEQIQKKSSILFAFSKLN